MPPIQVLGQCFSTMSDAQTTFWEPAIDDGEMQHSSTGYICHHRNHGHFNGTFPVEFRHKSSNTDSTFGSYGWVCEMDQ